MESAKALALADPKKLGQTINQLGITNQSALVEIALIVASHDSGLISHYIQNFGITDEIALARIAVTAATRNGESLSQLIKNYRISDPLLLAEVAETAATRFGWGTSKFIQNFGITDQAALVRIAKAAAAHNGMGTSRFISRYGITDKAELARIAKIAATHDGVGTSYSIESYGITNQADLIEIAKLSVSQSLIAIRFLTNYPLSETVLSAKVLGPVLSEITSGRDKERHFTNLRNSLAKICSDNYHRDLMRISCESWDRLEPNQRLAAVTEWFSDLHKKHTKRDLPLSGNLEVQAEEVIFDALSATIISWDTANVQRYGTRARASLAAFSGYDSLPIGELSTTACREMWGILITARTTIGPELASTVPVDLGGNRSQALKVLTLATALKGLGGELPTFSEPINTTERFQAAEKLLTERVAREFERCLSLDTSGSTSAVARLWDQWGGDLMPFTVLAGRYRSNKHWNHELPVVSEIAKRCLDGSFHEWRYRRDDTQLSMLSEHQLLGWTRNPVRISRISADAGREGNHEATQLENLANIFSTNLLHNLPADLALTISALPMERGEAETLLALDERSFNKRNIHDAVRLISYALSTKDMEKIRKAVALTNGAKANLLRDLPEADKKQLSADLKSMNDATKKSRAPERGQYCVVSVITDHPKLLLMTGDLVHAASCQNYRSGSQIQTLPGYVIDGNIKLALSYVVKAGVLDQLGVSDYATLTFDPATQSLRAPGGHKPLPLGYAMRREILRVGSVDGEAVCVTERPYVQTHALGNEIANHHRELVAAHLKASEIRTARDNEIVECPASRNPSGVYTDKGGGAQRGTYAVKA